MSTILSRYVMYFFFFLETWVESANCSPFSAGLKVFCFCFCFWKTGVVRLILITTRVESANCQPFLAGWFFSLRLCSSHFSLLPPLLFEMVDLRLNLKRPSSSFTRHSFSKKIIGHSFSLLASLSLFSPCSYLRILSMSALLCTLRWDLPSSC